MMSVLTILEASKKFNIGRTTIYKAIKRGELTPQLSESGVQMIDPQDMIRLFGRKRKRNLKREEARRGKIETSVSRIDRSVGVRKAQGSSLGTQKI